MIPRDFITEWRAQAPWVQDFQVEQDLVISRALAELYRHPLLARSLAFRGGTALYKLFLQPAARYSEDIDLVQLHTEPAGPVMDALREILNPWLGEPRWKQSEGRVTFNYRFSSEDTPALELRLKLEINTREHFTVMGINRVPFRVHSRWYEGECEITTYMLDELLGTKMRALYQRRKGRDLFDLALALENPVVDPARVIDVFSQYMNHSGQAETRAQFEQNLEDKLHDPRFAANMGPLLTADFSWDSAKAAEIVRTRLIARLPGEPWKSGTQAN